MFAPATAVVGCCTKANTLGVPGESVIDADVIPVNEGALNAIVYAPTTPLIRKFVNVAWPAAFVTAVRVPLSVPEPDASDAVTVTPACGTALLFASRS